jgi:hypothetical protein
MRCGMCGSDQIETSQGIDSFAHKVGHSWPQREVRVRYVMTIHTCLACDFQFADASARQARDQAIAAIEARHGS